MTTYEQDLANRKKIRGEFNKEMHVKYKEVAKLLGLSAGITKSQDPIEDQYNASTVLNGKNVAIHLIASIEGTGWAKPGMVKVSSDFPSPKTESRYVRPFGYNYTPISINVSSAKTAQQIASAIKSRFLETHIKEMIDVKKQCDDTDSYHNGRNTMMESIAKQTGFTVEKASNGEGLKIDLGGYLNNLKPIGKNECEVTLRVNEAQAVEIIKLAVKLKISENRD